MQASGLVQCMCAGKPEAAVGEGGSRGGDESHEAKKDAMQASQDWCKACALSDQTASAPLYVGPIAEVWHIQGSPAAPADVVTAYLKPEALLRVEEQIGKVAALRVRVRAHHVGKPAQ